MGADLTPQQQRDVRMAQTMACHVITDLYANHPMPPLYWTVREHPRSEPPSPPRLSGQVPRSSGDEDTRRRIVEGYAEAIGATPQTEPGELLMAEGVYEGVTVHVYTPLDEEDEKPRPGPVIDGTDSASDWHEGATDA